MRRMQASRFSPLSRGPFVRERGKSDVIDATAVARAAIREGVERLPAYTGTRGLPLARACPLNTAPPRSAPPSGILTAGVRMRALCSHAFARPPPSDRHELPAGAYRFTRPCIWRLREDLDQLRLAGSPPG